MPIKVFKYLRAGSFDTSTSAGREAERYRLAAWAVVSSLGSRALSVLLVVLGVRLTAVYLGSTRFGVWATFASLAAMLSFLDLGIGNALVNRVAAARAGGGRQELQQAVTGGIGLLALIGLAAGSVLSLLAQWLPWGQLFKLTDMTAVTEAALSARVFALLFAVNIFTAGLARILAGQQRLYEANLINAAGTTVACIGLWLVSRQQASVPWLLAATFGAQSIVGLSPLVLFIRRGLLGLDGLWRAMTTERANLFRTGSLYLVLQLGTMIGWGSDSVILASLQGASAVAVYAVAQRLFQFASQPFVVFNAPLWAAYADASARHDVGFMRATLRRSLGVSFAGAVLGSGTLLTLGPLLIPIWTHNAIVVPRSVLVLFATWTVLDVCGNCFAMYLNGCGLVRQQFVVVTISCALILPLKFFLGSKWGIDGILLSTILVYLLVNVGLYGTVFRKQILRPLRDG